MPWQLAVRTTVFTRMRVGIYEYMYLILEILSSVMVYGNVITRFSLFIKNHTKWYRHT